MYEKISSIEKNYRYAFVGYYFVFLHYSSGCVCGIKIRGGVNNTWTYATRTYDDWDNSGVISSNSDIDWWVVSFSKEGMANFWLGNFNINNYLKLSVYATTNNGSGLKLIASSDNQTSNSSRLIRCHVKSGVNYYVQISGTGNASSYKLRIKDYDLNTARFFAYKYSDGYDTTQCAADSMNYIWQMGFGGTWYRNNYASTIYSVLTTSQVLTIFCHGNAGLMETNGTYLQAKTTSGMSSNDAALDALADYALSNVSLIMFSGCYTGKTSSVYGNLVDKAIDKGAICCFGWTVETWNPYAFDWVVEFYKQCSLGNTVYQAAIKADALMLPGNAYSQSLTEVNRYYGYGNMQYSTVLNLS